MLDNDLSVEFQQQILTAIDDGGALNIVGGNSKAFYGTPAQSDLQPLNTTNHSGIIAYEPSELVVTVRSGTSLAELETLLAEHSQELPFEPPHFDGGATIGGCIAAGLSGPQRFRAGAVRDSLLGVKLINGKGQILSFGGQVMKNVAGYDLSRLMAGSMGTLGLLLEVSLKLRARPSNNLTLGFDVSTKSARELLKKWYQLPGIISATSYHDGIARIRLSGSEKTLAVMQTKMGGSPVSDAAQYWSDLKNHSLPFFSKSETLWRLAIPPMTPKISTEGEILEEWGGGLRWISAPIEEVSSLREQAAALGGHATLFRSRSGDNQLSRFHPLPETMMKLHRSLKTSLDPHGIFNPQRLYKEL